MSGENKLQVGGRGILSIGGNAYDFLLCREIIRELRKVASNCVQWLMIVLGVWDWLICALVVEFLLAVSVLPYYTFFICAIPTMPIF